MAPSSRKDNLEHEALNYIKLGTLVQRERPPETAAAIEEILSKNIPVEEKIKEIELVDGVPAPPVTSPPASRPYLSRPRDGGTDEEIIPRKPKQSVLAAARRRAKMIADIEATGVMDYLFKERRNVKKGAAGNLLLRPRLLSVEFREESARTLIERLQRETLPALDASLDLILAEGWRFLTKADYNLVALLRRLSASTARLIPSKLSPRWPQAAKGMYSLGIAFLPFRMEPGRAAAALSAVGTALAKLNYDGESLELARKHVIHLLQDGGPPACLQDLLLASAMVKARRFLSIGSLTKSDAGMLSSVEEFDCSNEVQDAIDVRIAELLEHLSELDETDKEAQQVRAFVKTDEAGDIDFLPLISFYEKGKTGGGSWDKDSDKLPVLVYNLVERFTAAAKPMADAESRRAFQCWRRNSGGSPRIAPYFPGPGSWGSSRRRCGRLPWKLKRRPWPPRRPTISPPADASFPPRSSGPTPTAEPKAAPTRASWNAWPRGKGWRGQRARLIWPPSSSRIRRSSPSSRTNARSRTRSPI